ncbi:CMGC/SRPK protein kinase, variant [Allomyces macrogynus ATCC 38327]|uniref:non-specific serine/threonine protein kinase n=1 Tax=Allomyces macrogynus (strain ATCC 38327) TaxID=578462 RepID=A0A0L0S5M0_ALLM3|nr:CMGC/SRPK protein kinase, variant [Allomyces macrogynus ATCC 38327]|eukprot:KNE57802.1 CMGC/SRPK protein kinase, variant [Allomyces macrogynus ATCC 38327]
MASPMHSPNHATHHPPLPQPASPLAKPAKDPARKKVAGSSSPVSSMPPTPTTPTAPIHATMTVPGSPAHAPHAAAAASTLADVLAASSSPAGAHHDLVDPGAYSDDDEDAKDYCPGGYHPVALGDSFKDGRYTVLRKLGWGHFSTVWLCRDNKEFRYVALKIVKSAPHYTETALDEILLLKKVVEADPTHLGRQCVVELYDDFVHQGPHGKHVCMVFEVLGENLLALIRRYRHQGIPFTLVKQIAAQVLCGLDYLHTHCHIIHTDIKPENVLIVVDVDEVAAHLGLESQADLRTRALERSLSDVTLIDDDEPSPKAGGNVAAAPPPAVVPVHKPWRATAASAADGIINVKIADLGNACWIDHHFTNDIQTRQYRCPEVILGAPWSTSVDMWSMACLVFELVTGDYLFDPQAGDRFSKDDDHMAQIIELIGPFPRAVALRGKNANNLFTRRGDLRNIRHLKMWPLNAVLHEKYRHRRDAADQLATFLTPMMDFFPDRRVTAAQALRSPWLNGMRLGERPGDAERLGKLRPAAATSAAAAASMTSAPATTAGAAADTKQPVAVAAGLAVPAAVVGKAVGA